MSLSQLNSNKFDSFGLGGGQEDVQVMHDRQERILVAQDGTGDYDNIQDAINELKVGGCIQIKEGTYKIKEKLSINKDSITIFGSGFGTIIYADTGFADNYILEVNNHNFTIQNLKMAMAAGVSTSFIKLVHASKCCIFNIFFDTGDVGIYIDANSHFNRIENNEFEADNYLCQILGDNNIISNNSGTDAVIKIESTGAHNQILGNVTGSENGTAIIVDGSKNIISNNLLPLGTNSGTTAGIDVDGSDNIFTGNLVSDISTDYFKKAFYVTGDRNVFTGNNATGVDYGIQFIAGADNNVCVGNFFSATDAVADAGAGNVIAHNYESA